MKHVILAALVGVLVSESAWAEVLRCDIAQKRFCTVTTCVGEKGGGEYVIVNTDNGTYSLCKVGEADCQILKIKNTRISGAFNVAQFAGASFIKIANQTIDLIGLERGSFVEVRDNMLGVMSSFGKCNPLQ